MMSASKGATLKLGGVPDYLSEKLIEEFVEIKKHYSMRDWGPGQLNGGRFAEVVLRIFQHLLAQSVTPFGTEIPNHEKTIILNTVQNHSSIDAHVRQKVAAIVRLFLDFRNNRDVAHLGGFDANSMDTAFIMTSASWVLCELLRVYSGVPMDHAQILVDGLSVKEYPVLMEFEGELYIARHDLKASEEVLVLLYRNKKANFEYLMSKSRDRHSTRFRQMLNNMKASKFIEKTGDEYFLMPRGMKVVEDEHLLHYSE